MAQTPPQYIFTRADDFGASKGTNDAILDCIDSGAVANVGILACGPAVSYRIEDLKARADKVSIGLHSAINSEWASLRWGPMAPPSNVPTLLAEDGHFHPNSRESHAWTKADEVDMELEAQYAHLKALGITPDYVDCHMGFSWIKGCTEVLENLAHKYNMVFADALEYPKLNLPADSDWRDASPEDFRHRKTNTTRIAQQDVDFPSSLLRRGLQTIRSRCRITTREGS